MNKRTSKLHFIALSFFLSFVLIVSGGVRPVMAEGTGSGTTEGDPYILDGNTTENENPFPDIISEAEMQTVREHAKNKLLSSNYIVKIEATLKDGSKILIGDVQEDGKVTYRMDLLQKTQGQITKIQCYMALLTSSDDKTVTKLGFLSAFRYTGDKVEFYDAKKHQVLLNRSSLKINNQDVSPTVEYIQYTGIKHAQYFTWTYDIPDYPVTYSRFATFPVQQGNYSTSFIVVNFFLIPTASFHYVDETAYKNQMGLDTNAAIPQRSNGTDISSMAPFTPIELTDLKVPLVLSDRYMIGALNPYFSLSADKPSNNYAFQEDGSTKATTPRPTYDQAMQDGPVGYVYVGDDIDKPENASDPNSYKSSIETGKGNYYFTPGLNADRTLAMEKHYYILERQMPSPVKIHKTDAQNHPLSGVTFNLYRVSKEEETLVKEGLTTDENGNLYASTEETVDQETLRTLTAGDTYDPQTGYVVNENLGYLSPGTYRLKETSVPEGYKKSAFDFTVKSVQDLVSDKDTPVPVQSFAFQNELAPKYPVEYSFISASAGKELPKEVTDLLPLDQNSYLEEETVTAIQPNKTEVKVEDGVWSFASYDADSKVANAQNLENGKILFTGTWKFAPNQIALNSIPTISANDRVLFVGNVFNASEDVTATDAEDGDLSANVEIIENNVPVDEEEKVITPGSYIVKYKVTDSQGASSTKTVTVTVNPAMETLNHIPVIQASDQVLTVGDRLEAMKEVTASDTEDGDLTGNIEIIENTVPVDGNMDTTTAGSYTITYKVTDSQGASSTKTVTVVVNPKMEVINTIPTIQAKDQELMVGEVFDPMKEVSARDVEDGDLTGSIQVLESNVPVDEEGKATKAGTYTITYTVTDLQGATATKTVQVTIKEPEKVPEERDNGTQPEKDPDKEPSTNQGQTSKEDKTKSSKQKQGAKTSTATSPLLYSAISVLTLLGLIGILMHYRKIR